MTRADKIKHMTDEELADFLFNFMLSCTKPDVIKSPKEYLDWLKHDVNDEQVTNGDRIRGMTDDELAERIHEISMAICTYPSCKRCPISPCISSQSELKDWLGRRSNESKDEQQK